jgi:hypothetical protein
MTANERFEKAWGSFLVYLNRNPKAQLTPFLKERYINHRTMMNWMCEKGKIHEQQAYRHLLLLWQIEHQER